MARIELPTLDIDHLIDERPMSGTQLLVAVLCAVAIFVDGYGMQVMAMTVPSLAQEWQLPPSRFGLALAASVIGLSFGSALLAPLGDRYGRRASVIAAMLLMGVSTCCTAFAATPEQFVFWRLLSGLGMGVSLPNCNAWTAEYAPLRRRALVLVLLNGAVAMGAFGAGYLAPPLIEAWTWRGAFVAGGVVPLALALLMWLATPESIKFLMARRPGDPRIAAVLRRIAPGVTPSMLVAVAVPTGAARGSVRQLFCTEYRNRTLLLSAMAALNLFTLFVLVSWLPTLLQASGWSAPAALRGAVLIQAGGVAGGIVLSLFIDRGKTLPAMFCAFLIAAASLAGFLSVPSGDAWLLLLLMTGAGVSGSQLSLNALSASYYPPAFKVTGMSCVAVLGGFGSIVAPLAGASLIERGMAAPQILALLAVPVLVCAAGTSLMRQRWQAH